MGGISEGGRESMFYAGKCAAFDPRAWDIRPTNSYSFYSLAILFSIFTHPAFIKTLTFWEYFSNKNALTK